MKRRLYVLAVVLAYFFWGGMSWAGVVIGGTRVIYPADQREVTIQLRNTGESPSLVQSWVDAGDPAASPESSQAPFMLFPPLARIEPDGGQVLRLVFDGSQGLPEDRETLFWLNVLEIPPLPQQEEGAPDNFMQFAFRSRIKLFYRPMGLEGSAGQAPEKVRWRLSQDAMGNPVVIGDNPTPFFVNVSVLEVRGDPLEIADGAIPPYGEVVFLLPGDVVPGDAQGKMVFINDYGGRGELEFSL